MNPNCPNCTQGHGPCICECTYKYIYIPTYLPTYALHEPWLCFCFASWFCPCSKHIYSTRTPSLPSPHLLSNSLIYIHNTNSIHRPHAFRVVDDTPDQDRPSAVWCSVAGIDWSIILPPPLCPRRNFGGGSSGSATTVPLMENAAMAVMLVMMIVGIWNFFFFLFLFYPLCETLALVMLLFI